MKKKETNIDLKVVNNSSLDKIFYKILKKDSALTNGIQCNELHISYYKNGNTKEKGCQGFYNGRGTSVGTWFRYDSINNLVTETYFHLDNQEKAYKKVVEFYINGKKKSVKYFKNDALYEIAADSIKQWLFFNKEGNLINTLNFNQP